MSAPRTVPPVIARAILRVSIPAGTLRDSILEDFAEEHRQRVDAASTFSARLWYWRHALGLAGRSLVGRLLTRDHYWVRDTDRRSGNPTRRRGQPSERQPTPTDTGRAPAGPGRAPDGVRAGSAGLVAKLDMFAQDLRFGVRQVVRRPGFSALVALTLAVGIGGNVAIFSVLKGIVLRPLPYSESDRLVAVWETPRSRGNYQPFSAPDYVDVREQAESLEEFGVLTARSFNLADGGEPLRVRGTACSAGLLRLLEVPPLHGRLFNDEEEIEGSERVLVIGYGFWQRHFGGAEDVVGREVIVDSQPYEIIGIMPERFETPTPWGGRDDSELWAPLVLPRDDETRGSHWLGGIARLADGVSAREAEVELQGIATQLAQAYPDTNGHTGMWVEPIMRRTLGGITLALLFLLIVVGLVLAVGCANVAGMLLARGASRLPELAVRASMGAGRRRLMGQLLTESLVLSALGGIAGVLLAYWGVGVLRGILPDNVPRVTGIQVDVTVLAFAAFVTLSTGLLFGLAPALFAARTDLARSLKEGVAGSRAVSGSSSSPLAALVGTQLAIGLILVNAAVVLSVSYANVMRQQLNFATDDVLVAGVSLVGPQYDEPHQRRAFWDDVLARIRGLPDVVDASLTSKIPLRGGANSGVLVNDDVYDPTQQDTLVEFSFVAHDYHETMGITLLAGRTFSAQDMETSSVAAEEEESALELPLVINRTMAEQFWPGESTLGNLVRPYSATEYFRGRVIGVVADTRQWGPEYRALPEMYFPHTAEVWGPSANRMLVVRTRGGSEAVEATLRAAVLEVDDRIPVSAAFTMANVFRDGTGRRRFSMLLVGLFAGTALLLVVAGTYGVMSFAVSQRTHEIGVRIALGADRRNVLRLFARRAARLLAPGLGFGIVGTFAASIVTQSMVYGISPVSILHLALAVAIMVLVSSAAILVPVMRAVRVDPLEALRSE